MKRILVIRFSSLGDIILCSPVTLNLRLRYPEAEIVFLTKPGYRQLAGALPGVDRVETLPESSGVVSLVRFAFGLDDAHFDLIVDLQKNTRSVVLNLLISSGASVSYNKRRLARELIVRARGKRRPATHTIDAYNRALRKIDPHIQLSLRRPRLNDSFCASLEDTPEKLRRWISEGEKIFLLAPDAKHTTKRAPLELFLNSARHLQEWSGCKILSVFEGGRDKLSLSGEFPAEDYLELVGVSLSVVASAIRNSTLALSNDSGIAHLCSALDLPVAVLFGPTHSSLGFSPRGVFDRVVEHEVFCQPCSLHGSKKCFRTERFCFSGIKQTQLNRTLDEMLDIRQKLSPALFLDRDGNVIQEKGFLAEPGGVVLHDGVAAALRLAQHSGFKLIIITNQSGVARGYITEEQVRAVNERVLDLLQDEGVKLTDVYYAPSFPMGVVERYRTPDSGRKPEEEMFLRAAREHNLDLRSSWMIGDRKADYLSARVFGGRGILVRTGYGGTSEGELERYQAVSPERVVDDLPAAIRSILEG